MQQTGEKGRSAKSFVSAGALRPSGRKIGLAMKTERKPALWAPFRSVSTPSPMQRMLSLATRRPLSACGFAVAIVPGVRGDARLLVFHMLGVQVRP